MQNSTSYLADTSIIRTTAVRAGMGSQRVQTRAGCPWTESDESCIRRRSAHADCAKICRL